MNKIIYLSVIVLIGLGFFASSIYVSAEESAIDIQVNANDVIGNPMAIYWNTDLEANCYASYSTNSTLSPSVVAKGAVIQVPTGTNDGRYHYQVNFPNIDTSRFYHYIIDCSLVANSDIMVSTNVMTFGIAPDTNIPDSLEIQVHANDNVIDPMPLYWDTDNEANCSVTYGTNSDLVSGPGTNGSRIQIPTSTNDGRWHYMARLHDLEIEIDTIYYYIINCSLVENPSVEATTDIKAFGLVWDPNIPRSIDIEVNANDIVGNPMAIYWNTDHEAVCFTIHNENESLTPKTYVQANIIQRPTDTNDGRYHYVAYIPGIDTDIEYYYQVECWLAANNNVETSTDIKTFGGPLSTRLDLEVNDHANDIAQDPMPIYWNTDTEAACVIEYYAGGYTDYKVIGEIIQSPTSSNDGRYHYTALLPDIDISKRYEYLVGCKSVANSDLTVQSAFLTFGVDSNMDDTADSGVQSDEADQVRDRIARLHLSISQEERDFVAAERSLSDGIDVTLIDRLAGTILLQVEGLGEAWYVDNITRLRYYLRDGASAYNALQVFGLGISNADLQKIPIGIEDRADMVDTDGDGASDKLENSLGSDETNPDTDGDGFSDGDEIKNGYDPNGPDALVFDSALTARLEGRILLQVEGQGQAWYVYKGKRYYMKDGDQAYQIMRFLSLGINNADLHTLPVGDFD